MDKFEQQIKDSKPEIEPSGDFKAQTMAKIEEVPKKRFGFNKYLPVGLGAVLVLIVALVLVVPSLKSNTSSTNNSGAATQSTAPASTNADLTSLNNDLSSIGAGLNQENSDQSFANTALNDNQQQITVPTN